MSKNWSEIIKDVEERNVFEALANPKWEYRTIEGIENETGILREKVRDIINKYEGELVAKSSVPDPKGRDLYVLKREKSEVQEFLAMIRTFLSKSVG